MATVTRLQKLKKVNAEHSSQSATHSEDAEMATEMAAMHQLLKRMDADQKKALTEIKGINKTTAAIEAKLTAITERLDAAETRISSLEDAAAAAQVDPPVTASQMDQKMEELQSRLDFFEFRSRKYNLKFRGFPENCCENNKVVDFLEKLLPTLLEINFPRGLVVDNAHRIPATRQEGKPARFIIAKFMCLQDVDLIKRTARDKDITWEGHKIEIFPDRTKAMEMKRLKFKEYKVALHSKGLSFALYTLGSSKSPQLMVKNDISATRKRLSTSSTNSEFFVSMTLFERR